MRIPNDRRSEAFSLVELLVVIAIVAMLVALMLPVVRSAREASLGLKCATQMCNVATAFNMFASDHDNVMPGNIGQWGGIGKVAAMLGR